MKRLMELQSTPTALSVFSYYIGHYFTLSETVLTVTGDEPDHE